MIVIPIRVLTPPLRKQMRRPRRTLHRKRKNKHHHLRSTVQRRPKNVVVLDEPPRVARAQPQLREPGDGKVRQDRRANANAEPADETRIVRP
jgi:hypothetical protein